MPPHTPQDRPAFERPDWKANEPQTDRARIEHRTRYSGTALLASILLLVAIFVFVAVL